MTEMEMRRVRSSAASDGDKRQDGGIEGFIHGNLVVESTAHYQPNKTAPFGAFFIHNTRESTY